MKTSEKLQTPQGETPSNLLLQPVGIIKSKIKAPFLLAGDDGINMQGDVADVRAELRKLDREIFEIVINADRVDLLDGVEDYSHLVVLYWAHKVPEKSRFLSRVHPMGRKEIPQVGIFSTCSPARPNPVLMTVVQLCGREGNVLQVTGLDAVDGSPVIDIKPYVKESYPQEQVRTPGWMESLLREADEFSRKTDNRHKA